MGVAKMERKGGEGGRGKTGRAEGIRLFTDPPMTQRMKIF